MKNVSILGSTGSIGTQTLDVIRRNADINVVALAAGTRVSDLAEQVREFKPQLVCIGKEELVPELKTLIGDIDVKIVSGDEGLIEAATIESAEIVVTAVVGMMGITPTVEAIKAHKDIALANKETLVCAGHIIMSLAKECNVNIYPVDSEHSAIFQCLNGENRGEIEKILLTASGGPFRGKKRADLENVQLEDALKHPNWAMGRKITIDSSTMVNKGLEVMEAQWLFGVPAEKVQVIVQPQSIIHSMVEFKDGAVMAQLGRIAEKYDCAILLVGHMNKGSGNKSSYRGLGSIDFQASARSVLIVGRIKDNPQVRVMVQDKSSLAPEGEAIAFELDKENGFSWLGHYDISVDDLLSGIPKEKKSEQAENLILEYLSKGKYPQQALLRKAQAMGISKRVLDEAKKALNVQSVKEGSQWYWLLPEKTE